jgi:diguanylate cyclase (GGDEF)-like protein
LIARYGGEEFVCVLPDTDITGAKIFAEELQQAVYDLKLPHPNSTISSYVTISLGVACCVPSMGMQNKLLETADATLYRAKIKGRNRFEVASECF